MKKQEQLSRMTEQDLTFELACLVFGVEDVVQLKKAVFVMSEMRKVDINDWSWIMPLAVEYKICIISPHSTGKVWSARFTDGGGLWSVSDIKSADSSPQRAIATCLILRLQETQE